MTDLNLVFSRGRTASTSLWDTLIARHDVSARTHGFTSVMEVAVVEPVVSRFRKLFSDDLGQVTLDVPFVKGDRSFRYFSVVFHSLDSARQFIGRFRAVRVVTCVRDPCTRYISQIAHSLNPENVELLLGLNRNSLTSKSFFDIPLNQIPSMGVHTLTFRILRYVRQFEEFPSPEVLANWMTQSPVDVYQMQIQEMRDVFNVDMMAVQRGRLNLFANGRVTVGVFCLEDLHGSQQTAGSDASVEAQLLNFLQVDTSTRSNASGGFLVDMVDRWYLERLRRALVQKQTFFPEEEMLLAALYPRVDKT